MNPKVNYSLVEKLLNLALDDAASKGEIENASKKMIDHLRQAKARSDDFVVEKVVYVDVPIEKIVYVDKPVDKIVYIDMATQKKVPTMTFGKFKGVAITEVEPSYLLWALENVDSMNKILQQAICDLLGVEIVK